MKKNILSALLITISFSTALSASEVCILSMGNDQRVDKITCTNNTTLMSLSDSNKAVHYIDSLTNFGFKLQNAVSPMAGFITYTFIKP